MSPIYPSREFVPHRDFADTAKKPKKEPEEITLQAEDLLFRTREYLPLWLVTDGKGTAVKHPLPRPAYCNEAKAPVLFRKGKENRSIFVLDRELENRKRKFILATDTLEERLEVDNWLNGKFLQAGEDGFHVCLATILPLKEDNRLCDGLSITVQRGPDGGKLVVGRITMETVIERLPAFYRFVMPIY